MLKRYLTLAVVLALVAVVAGAPPAQASIPPCCLVAIVALEAISDLTTDTTTFLATAGGPAARGAQAIKALGKASEAIFAIGEEPLTCQNPKDKLRIQNSKGWLQHYINIMTQYGATADPLIADATAIMDLLDLILTDSCPI